MAKVEIYTLSNCPYCVMAKNLLNAKKIPYTEYNIDNNEQKKEELYQKTKQTTVPFIFINDQFIGGYTDLKELDNTGKLNEILNEL